MLFEQELFGGWLPSPLLSCSVLMCAARSQLSKGFDERGGKKKKRRKKREMGGGRERGGVRKGPKENPSFSRVLSLPNLTRLPLILQSPSLISFPLLLPPFFFSICCLSSSLSQTLITHCTFLSLSHTDTSEQPATHPGCN